MALATFRNPLHPVPLADPFVLKFNGSYYAYGTPASGGIPALRSVDLVHWEEAGMALTPPPAGHSHWAPEVAYDNGHFFIYYSTGGPEGEGHQLRVARATSPVGPFEAEEEVLDPDDAFTIDAHPFRDDDGEWYLFYSRDFLEGEPIGTGIVVDRLVDMSQLAGERATVLRPHAEWHIFERQRHWYDRVSDWFTVEGPFVRKHGGRYWCFYSGGAWRGQNYGVSWAVADHPLGPYEPAPTPEGAAVLRTAPGRVIGPGHACVVTAPDNVSEYLVYHAWDPARRDRYMCTDRLLWVDGRPASPGPLTDPQPFPEQPAFRDLFDGGDGAGLDRPGWRARGGWVVHRGEVLHAEGGTVASAVLSLQTPDSYLLEVNLAGRGSPSANAAYGILSSYLDDDDYSAVLIQPCGRRVIWRQRHGGAVVEVVLARLKDGFRSDAYHQLLVRRTVEGLEVKLDGVALQPVAPQPSPGAVGLWTDAPAAFAGVSLTDLSSLEKTSRADSA